MWRLLVFLLALWALPARAEVCESMVGDSCVQVFDAGVVPMRLTFAELQIYEPRAGTEVYCTDCLAGQVCLPGDPDDGAPVGAIATRATTSDFNPATTHDEGWTCGATECSQAGCDLSGGTTQTGLLICLEDGTNCPVISTLSTLKLTEGSGGTVSGYETGYWYGPYGVNHWYGPTQRVRPVLTQQPGSGSAETTMGPSGLLSFGWYTGPPLPLGGAVEVDERYTGQPLSGLIYRVTTAGTLDARQPVTMPQAWAPRRTFLQGQIVAFEYLYSQPAGTANNQLYQVTTSGSCVTGVSAPAECSGAGCTMSSDGTCDYQEVTRNADSTYDFMHGTAHLTIDAGGAGYGGYPGLQVHADPLGKFLASVSDNEMGPLFGYNWRPVNIQRSVSQGVEGDRWGMVVRVPGNGRHGRLPAMLLQADGEGVNNVLLQTRGPRTGLYEHIPPRLTLSDGTALEELGDVQSGFCFAIQWLNLLNGGRSAVGAERCIAGDTDDGILVEVDDITFPANHIALINVRGPNVQHYFPLITFWDAADKALVIDDDPFTCDTSPGSDYQPCRSGEWDTGLTFGWTGNIGAEFADVHGGWQAAWAAGQSAPTGNVIYRPATPNGSLYMPMARGCATCDLHDCADLTFNGTHLCNGGTRDGLHCDATAPDCPGGGSCDANVTAGSAPNWDAALTIWSVTCNATDGILYMNIGADAASETLYVGGTQDALVIRQDPDVNAERPWALRVESDGTLNLFDWTSGTWESDSPTVVLDGAAGSVTADTLSGVTISASSSLTTSGTGTISTNNGNITANGTGKDVTASDDVISGDDVTVGDDLNVTDDAQISDHLTVSGGASITGTALVTGSAVVTQGASVGGEMSVGGVSSDGTGRIVCIQSDGTLGTCTDGVSGSPATCTCTSPPTTTSTTTSSTTTSTAP